MKFRHHLSSSPNTAETAEYDEEGAGLAGYIVDDVAGFVEDAVEDAVKDSEGCAVYFLSRTP